MKIQRTSVGLDVHARSVVACALDGDTGEVFQRRLTPNHGEIVAWLGDLPGPMAPTYEPASPAVRARGRAANRHLNLRWAGFDARKKRPVIVDVAIARELGGWCRSLATMPE